jgi:hypothetical protein
MTDEERLEESVHAEEEDFEAHKKRALADEPAADDDGDDDVEAHRRRA